MDAAGELLAERGTAFTLPDLARASGVATATVYRHFAGVHDVFAEFYQRLIDELVAELAGLSARTRGRRRFEAACARWVALAAGWGRAATHIRSADGFLERVRRDDPPTSALFEELAAIIEELVADEVLPPQDVEYAVLVWVTLLDERVIVDLTSTLGWSAKRVGRTLAESVLAALAVP
ncbi:TetR family transcriptional regulator [Actinomadura sp. LD22]|uniref:TetR family transcriptional regulator n=1 Tax=Actinomadura physcomitrii TaxID=2650748 RepID=A0A6I4MBC5_9ACTN|nr:TetR family transcriptional regulator [Actinomadura physcomitrii]